MKLYLGTNNERGIRILGEGKIRCSIDRIHDSSYAHLATTDGYTYMTDEIPVAIYYGNKAQVNIPPISAGNYYLFEIEIDIDELHPDIDELRIQNTWQPIQKEESDFTVEDSLSLVHSVTVTRDLLISTDVVRYAILPDANSLDHDLLHITKECIFYRPNQGTSIPESVNQIPWLTL